MPKRGTIMFVAILLDTDYQSEIADALNETLRPCTQNPTSSWIIDYAFNFGTPGISGGPENCPKLPRSRPYKIHPSYRESDFIGDMVDDRKLEREAGLAVMDQVADVIASRDEMKLADVQQEILDADCQELYEAYIGPAIDALAQALEDRRKGGTK